MSVSVRGLPAPQRYLPELYWEERARRFAGEGAGLAAVCAYGMPEFYNRAIDLEQRLALEPWLHVSAATRVLDVGCGVGRWSRLLAARGATVTGLDLSPTMIAQARSRAAAQGVAARCRFDVQNVSDLTVDGAFDLVLGVTVLQHILDPGALRAALLGMSARLAPGGRIILLEAAPTRRVSSCDTTVFKARFRESYLQLFDECKLDLTAQTGVDPAPCRYRLLPHLRSLPRPVGLGLIALSTGITLPINTLLGRRAIRSSWHAVFALQARAGESRHGD